MKPKKANVKKANVKNAELKNWTVMIYLAGDNNLSQECIWAIKEMYRVGLHPDANVAVVAQFDSVAEGVPVTKYDIGRVAVANDGIKKSASSALQVQVTAPSPAAARNYDEDGGLGQYGEELPKVKRFISATELKTFILKCTKKYPAERYMVVLSGHGAGAVGQNFLKEDRLGRYLSIPRLRFALEEVNEVLARQPGGKKIDILGLDACAMSMAEVAYDLRHVVDYMVGAEGFEVNTGWPYHRILQLLDGRDVKMPDGEADLPELHTSQIEPDALCIGIVDKYVTYYSDFAVAGVSVDQAACSLKEADKLADAVAELAVTLPEKIKHEMGAETNPAKQKSALLDAVILAHWRAQSYKYEEYVDLWDFCHLLDEGCNDKDVKAACQKVMKVIGHAGVKEEAERDMAKHMEDVFGTVERCVLKSCYSGAAYQHSHGLSIYFPWAEVSHEYKNLRFARKTGWYGFLKFYVEHSRRRPHKGSGKLRHIFLTHDPGTIVRNNRPFDKMGEVITPRVKNPPNGYYTDDCILLLRGVE